jgi:hypothetical protein
LASAWPRSLTEPRIDRQAELREHPRRVKSQAKSLRQQGVMGDGGLARPLPP